MTSKYAFSDAYLGISDTHIHVLRNRFEVTVMPFQSVEEIRFYRGKAIKNWGILLGLGIALLLAGLRYSWRVMNFLNYGTGTIYVELIIMLLFLFIFGSFFVYKALAKAPIIEVIHFSGKHKTSVSSFAKAGELEAMKAFLKKRAKVREA